MHAETEPKWFPVAVARDILDGMVVPARLPFIDIAVWRSQSGTLSANVDRCPHRGMRLSHGFVRGETLSCIYHGWRFGPDGGCRHIPAHPDLEPPASINCGSLPVLEQDGVVWAASAPPLDLPPAFEGFQALRSLVFETSRERILSDSGGQETAEGVSLSLGALKTQVVLCTRAPQDVFAIALVPFGASPETCIAASQAIEQLRHRAEATESAKETA